MILFFVNITKHYKQMVGLNNALMMFLDLDLNLMNIQMNFQIILE